MMILIKLGGSVITDKTRYRTFNSGIVSRLCREIKESGKEVMIVHGAGSLGHVLAKEHDINSGFKEETQIPAVARICYDVRELNSMVVSELISAGIPSVSVPTGSCFVMDNRDLIFENDEPVRRFRDLGIVPVLFGDVVTDRSLGFAICSGDQIMERLADLFDPELVVFVSDIDGLYDKNPRTERDAVLYDEVDSRVLKEVSTKYDVDDVTGGVRAKMESMLRMCSGSRCCVLVNGNAEGRLLKLLRGERIVCTTAKGGIS